MPKNDKLSEKQRRFVEAYMGEAAGNATEAARIAGYAGNTVTLGAVGGENLQKPLIRAAIEARTAKDPRVAKRKDLQRFWTDILSDPRVEMKDRLRASELLAKSQGHFISRSKVELDGKLAVARKAEDLTDDELAAIATGGNPIVGGA